MNLLLRVGLIASSYSRTFLVKPWMLARMGIPQVRTEASGCLWWLMFTGDLWNLQVCRWYLNFLQVVRCWMLRNSRRNPHNRRSGRWSHDDLIMRWNDQETEGAEESSSFDPSFWRGEGWGSYEWCLQAHKRSRCKSGGINHLYKSTMSFSKVICMEGDFSKVTALYHL